MNERRAVISTKTDAPTAHGALVFARGVMSQSFTVLLTINAYVDGTRYLHLSLSNPNFALIGNNSHRARFPMMLKERMLHCSISLPRKIFRFSLVQKLIVIV